MQTAHLRMRFRAEVLGPDGGFVRPPAEIKGAGGTGYLYLPVRAQDNEINARLARHRSGAA